MKKLVPVLLLVLAFACAKESSNFTLKGHIKGLKKGTVYLQRFQDSSLVTIDSLVINGNPKFELHTDLESPEVLYLKLHKHDNIEHIVSFFADKGITEISSNLKNFDYDIKITGSKQQAKLEEYNKMMTRFNDQNLDLLKDNFEAQKDKDTSKLAATLKNQSDLIKRKYLYTVNFAINNRDSEVAPYLVLSEIYDANVKYLDTVNNSLTPEVKASKYGKELQAFIDGIKSE